MRLTTTLAIVALLLGQIAATGQPTLLGQGPKLISGLPVESVTVIATRPSEAAIKRFVETRAMPTYVLGRLARWTVKLCPQTVGLGGAYAQYVTQRIRDVAAAVGAPVNADPACRPNLEVAFTTTPQGLMDNVRKKEPLFLGYYRNSHEADDLAKVTHAIQAWYTTISQDMDGSRQIDSGKCGGGATLNTTTDVQATAQVDPTSDAGGTAGYGQLTLPCAIVVHSNGSRVRDGLSSGFFNVLIVAEPAKLYDYEIGSLADYITMLALSQPASLDSCQQMPSISNMLAPDCASATSRITDADLSYLKALYKLPEGEFLNVQRDYIGYEMNKTLVNDKGG